jgi:hypothetical protein
LNYIKERYFLPNHALQEKLKNESALFPSVVLIKKSVLDPDLLHCSHHANIKELHSPNE